MNLYITDTAATMATQVADRLDECLRSIRSPLVCPASGDTPASLYSEILGRVHKKTLEPSNWYFVGLDEWVGMNGQDEGSCRYYLDQALFHPLEVAPERICFFDGRAADLEMECTHTENFIQKWRRIDAVILGIGTNGHVAMNEPGTDPKQRSHVSELHPATKSVGQKYFTKQQSLERGITLGLGTLLEARHIFLLATGEHKAAIVEKALKGPITRDVPASLLRLHPGLEVYLDAAATGTLSVDRMC